MPDHRFCSSWTEGGPHPTCKIHLPNNSHPEAQEAAATRQPSCDLKRALLTALRSLTAVVSILMPLDVKGKLNSAASHLSCVGELGTSKNGVSWAVLIRVVLARFDLFGVAFGWIGMVWGDLACLGLVWLGLAYFRLIWLGLGWFGLFWVVLDCLGAGPLYPLSPSPAPNRPAPHSPARRPLARAAVQPLSSTCDWADLQSILHLAAFRLAALGRLGTPVPLGGRRGAGPDARCAIPSGVPGTIPGGISCRHGARLPGAENHPPGEGSGENRRGAQLRVAFTRRGCLGNGERGALRRRGGWCCHGGGDGAGPGGLGREWLLRTLSLHGSGAVGAAKGDAPYPFLHSCLFLKVTAVLPHPRVGFDGA